MSIIYIPIVLKRKNTPTYPNSNKYTHIVPLMYIEGYENGEKTYLIRENNIASCIYRFMTVLNTSLLL